MKIAESLEDALRQAIEMENQGRCHYMALASATDDPELERLFQELAVAEDEHRKRFVEILYNEVLLENVPPEEAGNLGTVTCTVTGGRDRGHHAAKTPDDVAAGILEALEMEKESRDLYTRRAAEAVDLDLARFYEALAAEEHGHWLALKRAYEDIAE